MTVTSRKVQANRENAKKSTGPRSAEGKARASRNAAAPPLESLLLPPESVNRDYTIILLELQEDLAPRGVMQGMLVERIASILWKIRRLQQAEEHLTRACVDASIRGKRLALKSSDPESMLDELGEHDRKHFESILDDTPVSVSPQAWYRAALAADSRQINWLQRYELQLQRTLHAALREWHRLRKAAAVQEELPEEDRDLAVLMNSTSRTTLLTRLYEAEIAATFQASPASESRPEQASVHRQDTPPSQTTRPSTADDECDGHLPDLEAPPMSDSRQNDAEPVTASVPSDADALYSSSEEQTITNEANVKMENLQEQATPPSRRPRETDLP